MTHSLQAAMPRLAGLSSTGISATGVTLSAAVPTLAPTASPYEVANRLLIPLGAIVAIVVVGAVLLAAAVAYFCCRQEIIDAWTARQRAREHREAHARSKLAKALATAPKTDDSYSYGLVGAGVGAEASGAYPETKFETFANPALALTILEQQQSGKEGENSSSIKGPSYDGLPVSRTSQRNDNCASCVGSPQTLLSVLSFLNAGGDKQLLTNSKESKARKKESRRSKVKKAVSF